MIRICKCRLESVETAAGRGISPSGVPLRLYLEMEALA
jgi:hypothetical protein